MLIWNLLSAGDNVRLRMAKDITMQIGSLVIM
jgi:hypothetical protein